MTAAIESFRVDRRMNIKPFEPIAGQHRPKRRRDRNSALGIEPVGEMRDKAVHSPNPCLSRHDASFARRSTPQRSEQPIIETGQFGIAWDIMGVNEDQGQQVAKSWEMAA